MMRYSVQPRDQILVKGDWSLYLMKMWEKNIGKDISKNLTSKYSQKLLDHPKRLATDAIKTALKRQLKKKKNTKKPAEVTGDLMMMKLPIKLQKLRNIHHRILQSQLKAK